MQSKNKIYMLYVIGVLCSLLWSSAFPLTKIAQEYFSAGGLAFLRCLFASVILLIISKTSGGAFPNLKDLPLFALAGLFGFSIYLILFNTGLKTLSAATASIIVSINPILSAIWATIFTREKISLKGWICIFVIFAGIVVLVAWEGVLTINAGVMWTLLGAFIFSIYNILNRKLIKLGYRSLEVTCYNMIFGALFLSMYAKESIPQLFTASTGNIAALVYLIIFPSSIAYYLYGKAFSLAEKTSTVTNFIFLNPFFSSILGFLLLREIPNVGFFLGGSIIIGCLVLFNYFESKSQDVLIKQ